MVPARGVEGGEGPALWFPATGHLMGPGGVGDRVGSGVQEIGARVCFL